MKQLLIPHHGPPEVLAVREAPDPAVMPGTVRIRVKAAGINFSDLLARQRLY
jgi:NADPH:quinone reductase-like Zn-dependent oxidoreductase